MIYHEFNEVVLCSVSKDSLKIFNFKSLYYNKLIKELIKPRFKLILCCNEIPSWPPDDSACWSRIEIIPFQLDKNVIVSPNSNSYNEIYY